MAAQTDGNEMMIDVSECVSITNDAGRFACFDDITSHLRNRPAISNLPVLSLPRNRAPVPAQEIADEQTTSSLAEFGTEIPSVARVEQNGEGDQELFDKVASVRERQPGNLLITLESGQVWYQVISKSFRLREGMSVRIYPAPFGGSYRLASTDINGFIQVRRVQ